MSKNPPMPADKMEVISRLFASIGSAPPRPAPHAQHPAPCAAR